VPPELALESEGYHDSDAVYMGQELTSQIPQRSHTPHLIASPRLCLEARVGHANDHTEKPCRD